MMSELTRRIAQGRGETPADRVLRGGRVFDLMTGAFLAGDVALCGEVIVGIAEAYEGREVIDVSGLTLVPGFIDTHLHIESALVTPLEFDRCVTPHGVTTAICDPHEIANVLGAEGIRYFQEASRQTVMDLRVQLSSCVPATEMETAGARVEAADLQGLMDHPSAIGLAEMMNYPGVLHCDPEVMKKLALFEGGHIDGHCPMLSGRDLNGYIAAGIRTEHEATSAGEALEKLRKGLRVLIREGTVCHDLDALQPVLNDISAPYMCLCTDDRNPLDIAEHGHLDYLIRRLIELGTSPLAAYRAASLSAAEAFNLKDRGLIAPGLRADIVAVSNLEECRVAMVLCAGRVVDAVAFAERGEVAVIGRHSVRAPQVQASDFHYCRTCHTESEVPVIGICEGKVLTEHRRVALASNAGDMPPDPSCDLARVAVVERHGKNGNIATGFVQGFGMQYGAIAATVAHDHHNIVCVGMDYADLARAVGRLSEIEGGFVVVQDGEVLAELALPIAGLMSMESFEQVHEGLLELHTAARKLGVTLQEPFIQLSFIALPVIPSLKITDYGMVDVERFAVI